MFSGTGGGVVPGCQVPGCLRGVAIMAFRTCIELHPVLDTRVPEYFCRAVGAVRRVRGS
jgi:hypothetical protein